MHGQNSIPALQVLGKQTQIFTKYIVKLKNNIKNAIS